MTMPLALPPGRVPAPCIPDDKIHGYVLDVNHADGGPKDEFFLGRGFTIADPRPFIHALFDHGRDEHFVRVEENKYVTKYIYEGPMPCPDGSSPKVRSVWKLMDEGIFRSLVTAYAI